MCGNNCKCNKCNNNRDYIVSPNSNSSNSTDYVSSDNVFTLQHLLSQFTDHGYDPIIKNGNTLVCTNMQMSEVEFQNLLLAVTANNSDSISISGIGLSYNINNDNYTYSKVPGIVSQTYRKMLNQKMNSARNGVIKTKKMTADSTTSEISLAQLPISAVDNITDLFGLKSTVGLQKKVNSISVRSTEGGLGCANLDCAAKGKITVCAGCSCECISGF